MEKDEILGRQTAENKLLEKQKKKNSAKTYLQTATIIWAKKLFEFSSLRAQHSKFYYIYLII